MREELLANGNMEPDLLSASNMQCIRQLITNTSGRSREGETETKPWQIFTLHTIIYLFFCTILMSNWLVGWLAGFVLLTQIFYNDKIKSWYWFYYDKKKWIRTHCTDYTIRFRSIPIVNSVWFKFAAVYLQWFAFFVSSFSTFPFRLGFWNRRVNINIQWHKFTDISHSRIHAIALDKFRETKKQRHVDHAYFTQLKSIHARLV